MNNDNRRTHQELKQEMGLNFTSTEACPENHCALPNELPVKLLLEKFVDLLIDTLKVEPIFLFVYNPQENLLTVKVSKGNLNLDPAKYFVQPGEGTLGKVFLEKEVYINPNCAAKNCSNTEPEGCLYIPLCLNDFNYGVIVLCHSQPRLFLVEEVEKILALAKFITFTIRQLQVTNARNSLANSTNSILNSLITIDKYLFLHSARVAQYCAMVAQQLGLFKSALGTLRTGALLHDIGKVLIPGSILFHPGPLSENQFDTIRKHPQIGASMLPDAEPFAPSLPSILYHHERYDGKGYPFGLKGKEIPQEARIITVADSFDAMVSGRPYKKSFSVEKAIIELKLHAGSQFDPKVVKAFLQALGTSSTV